jgi:hypothetical protein
MKVQSRDGIGRGIEPVARVGGAIAVEVVGGSVEVVCAGLDTDVDDGTGLPAVIGFGSGLNVEFLDRVDGQMRGGRAFDALGVDDGRAVIGVVVVDTVDDEVVVFGAVAVRGDGLKSSAGDALDAGLKDGEVLEVASLKR